MQKNGIKFSHTYPIDAGSMQIASPKEPKHAVSAFCLEAMYMKLGN